MPWVRLDDHYPEHPKMIEAGPLAMALDVAALAYCNRNATDGFVPAPIVSRLIDTSGLLQTEVGPRPDAITTGELAQRLVKAGRWVQEEGGFRIHDYADYQPTSTNRSDLSAKRAEAGRKGAEARWGSRNGSRDTSVEAVCARVSLALEDEFDPQDIEQGIKELRVRLAGGDPITSPTKFARKAVERVRDERLARVARAAKEKADRLAREETQGLDECEHGNVRRDCATCKQASAQRAGELASQLRGVK